MTGRFGLLNVWAVLCLGLFALPFAHADDHPAPAAVSTPTGVTTGLVKDKSAEFLLIQSPDNVARRHWLTGIESAAPTATAPATTAPAATQPSTASAVALPDLALVATFNRIQTGDEVEVRWADVGRRRMESLRVTRRAAMIAALVAATQPGATPPTPLEPSLASRLSPPVSPDHSSAATNSSATTMPTTAPSGSAVTTAPTASTGSTLGERVNATIDDLLALGMRLIELPMWMLLTVVIVVGGGVFALARRLDRWNRPSSARRLRTILRVGGVLFVALLIDRKIAGLQTEVDALRIKISSDTLALIDRKSAGGGTGSGGGVGSAARTGRPLMFDPVAAQKSLAAHFKDVNLQPSVYDAATDVVQIQIGDPLVKAYIAIVDLTNPAVTIKLGTNLETKTLTSVFAKETSCGLAINGEAGQSPAMNSGLGVWRGNMIYDGKIVSREDPKILRPFIGFDKANHAAFVPAAQTDRTLPTNQPTLIWGRLDAVVNGVVQTADERYSQPRTAMGIGQNGTRLYLLVIDGRQQRRSLGATRAEVGYLLQAFGCDNGMLCDEGGSSCMYLKQAGGIVNVPSDGNGEERPTYTHFGVSLQ